MRGLDDDRSVEAGLAHARHHAEAVEVGHDEVEHDAVDVAGGFTHEQSKGLIAAFGDNGLIAETLHHGFDQTALYRIVIDDQHHFRHESLHHRRPRESARLKSVPIWCSVCDPA